MDALRHDMSREAIESGPVGPRAGSWEDDETGGPCSACGGDGYHEHPETLREYECPICGGSGVAA